jgi:hypothetical protein
MSRGPKMRMTVGNVVITWTGQSGDRPFRTFAGETKARSSLRAANDMEQTRLGQITPRLRLVSGRPRIDAFD